MAEHGGNLDKAISRFGGTRADWIDLSTGINPHAYPVPQIPEQHWQDLPDKNMSEALISAAQKAYQTDMPILPMAGAQQAIQNYPILQSQGTARLLHPTYNEHGLQLRRTGWIVEEKQTLIELAGSDLAVIVNPNNPDGQKFAPADLMALSQQVGLLIVDESFVDVHPTLSLCPHVTEAHSNILILRSFGKFYGLAGLRLGFAIGASHLLETLAVQQGSWAVSGPALSIGCTALADTGWADETRKQLAADVHRLDSLALQAGWRVYGGCDLFRLYEMDDAQHWQDILAEHQIWSRCFCYAPNWLRLGLPPIHGWSRLETALKS